jgi:hypothetical protein
MIWSATRSGRTAHLYSWHAAFHESGPQQLHAALTFLAEVQPLLAGTEPQDGRLRDWRQEVERLGSGFFVTTREEPSLPPGTLLRVA